MKAGTATVARCASARFGTIEASGQVRAIAFS
jgi:hypothetical protein